MKKNQLRPLLESVIWEAEEVECIHYSRKRGPSPKRWSEKMRTVLSLARTDGNALDFLDALHEILKRDNSAAEAIWKFRCLMHKRPTFKRPPHEELKKAIEESGEYWDWSAEIPNEAKTALADLRLYRALRYDTMDTIFFDTIFEDLTVDNHLAYIAAASLSAPEEDWIRTLLDEKIGDLHLEADEYHAADPSIFQHQLKARFHESLTFRPLIFLTDMVLTLGDPGMPPRLIQSLRNNLATYESVNSLKKLLDAGHRDARAALIHIGVRSQGKVLKDVTGRAISAGLSASG